MGDGLRSVEASLLRRGIVYDYNAVGKSPEGESFPYSMFQNSSEFG